MLKQIDYYEFKDELYRYDVEFSEEAIDILFNHFSKLEKEESQEFILKADELKYEIMEADENYIRDLIKSISPRQSVEKFLKDRGAYIGETAAGDFLFYTNDF